MSNTLKVMVFGKAGCDKCTALNRRLERMLKQEEWRGLEKEYCDLETEDGLVAFSEAECINPQRIPAMILARKEEETGEVAYVVNPRPGAAGTVCDDSLLYQYLGLQTDYSQKGKGVLRPEMIEYVLRLAVPEQGVPPDEDPVT